MQFGELLVEVEDGGQLFKDELRELCFPIFVRAHEANIYLFHQREVLIFIAQEKLLQKRAALGVRELFSDFYLYSFKDFPSFRISFKYLSLDILVNFRLDPLMQAYEVSGSPVSAFPLLQSKELLDEELFILWLYSCFLQRNFQSKKQVEKRNMFLF